MKPEEAQFSIRMFRYFKPMLTWAETNLTPAKLQEFDAIFNLATERTALDHYREVEKLKYNG